MRFAHTNIAARDWKIVADFYINVFDCKIKPPQRDLKGKWLDDAIGIKNARQVGVHLTLPGYEDTDAPTLEIFSYDEVVDNSPIMANHIGFTHIAFEVESVDTILEKALKYNASKLGKVIEKEVEGVGLLKFTYLRDPEGNIVEIQSWS